MQAQQAPETAQTDQQNQYQAQHHIRPIGKNFKNNKPELNLFLILNTITSISRKDRVTKIIPHTLCA
jgi:hypothetical protein